MKIYKKIILASIGLISTYFASIVLTSCGSRSSFINDKKEFYKTNGAYEFIGYVPESYQNKSVDRILSDFQYTEAYTLRNFKNLELFQSWIMNSRLLNTNSIGNIINILLNSSTTENVIEARYYNFNFATLTNMEVLYLNVYGSQSTYYIFNFELLNEWNSNEPAEKCNFKWVHKPIVNPVV